MLKKMIRIRGELYEFTEMLAQRDDAVVLEVDDGVENVVEKKEVVYDAPATTATRKPRAPAPAVVVVRADGDAQGLGAAALAEMKRG